MSIAIPKWDSHLSNIPSKNVRLRYIHLADTRRNCRKCTQFSVHWASLADGKNEENQENLKREKHLLNGIESKWNSTDCQETRCNVDNHSVFTNVRTNYTQHTHTSHMGIGKEWKKYDQFKVQLIYCFWIVFVFVLCSNVLLLVLFKRRKTSNDRFARVLKRSRTYSLFLSVSSFTL